MSLQQDWQNFNRGQAERRQRQTIQRNLEEAVYKPARQIAAARAKKEEAARGLPIHTAGPDDNDDNPLPEALATIGKAMGVIAGIIFAGYVLATAGSTATAGTLLFALLGGVLVGWFVFAFLKNLPVIIVLSILAAIIWHFASPKHNEAQPYQGSAEQQK